MLRDIRYAVRMLRKSPLFTVAVVGTIALGIGANTAIFSVVNAVMLRPLPFTEPDRLVWVAERNDKLRLPRFAASVLNYLSWKEQSHVFEPIGAFGFGTYSLTGSGGDPEQITGGTLSASLFGLLGIRPVAGRSFVEADEQPGRPKVAMISEALWTHRFAGDPSTIGRSVSVNGVDTTIVGIVPTSLTLLSGGDMWLPLTIDPPREIRLNHVILAVGRIRPGLTLTQAQAEMDGVAGRISQQYPEMKEWGVRLVGFYDWIVNPQLRTALIVLLSAVGCVLLIASVNVANLLLARASSRQREMAVRTALGAGRGRLVGQMLTESLILSTLGGAAGLLAGIWAVRTMNALLPPNLLPIPTIEIDSRVFLFALVLALVTGVVFGFAPAWHAAKTDLNDVLKQAARSSTGARPRLRNGLAATELALATLLLVGAGLLTQSLLRLQHVTLGFHPGRLLTFQLALPQTKYAGLKGAAFYHDLLENLRAAPGVVDAAISSGVPFGAGNYTTTPIATTGASALPPDAAVPTDWRIVSPGYFRTMKIPMLRGRDFNDGDGPTAAQVVIVSQATATRFWGDTDPLGRSLHRQGDRREYTVVGVVGDVRHSSLNQESPAIYYASTAGRVWPLMDVVVRSQGEPTTLLPTVRQRVRALDDALPVATVRTMEEWVSTSATQPRLNAILLGVFAAVALIIAAIGVYGVLAYSVNQRTKEIGLRMALGAQRSGVLRLIVSEGMTVALIGIGIGLTGAVALSRVLTSMVYGVPVRDPLTYSAVAAGLGLVALAACIIPARRASKIDPMVALRQE